MGKNKIVFGDEVLIDISADTVDAAHLLVGSTAHDRSGEPVNGACTFDMDTSTADAAQAEILAGKKAGVNGAMVTGSMPNNGQQMLVIDDVSDSLQIPFGFHDGTGRAYLKGTEVAKIIPANLKAGITILGQTGTYAGEPVTAQSKTATPSRSQYTVLPDSGYDYLSQVVVAAIPYTETPNAAGGTTVTIG